VFGLYHFHSVLLTAILPDIPPTRRRLRSAGALLLSVLAVSVSVAATVPPQTPETTRQPAATVTPKSELQARLLPLNSAKQGDDPAAVADAARRVIALALRQIGQAKVMEGSFLEAVEIYRRSLDFEDAPDTHVDLAAAYLAAGKISECLSEAANTIASSPENAGAWHIYSKVLTAKKDQDRAGDAEREAQRLAGPGTRFDWEIPAHPTAVQRQQAKARGRELSRILASALNDLGTTEARQQKYDLALAHFHEAERWYGNTPSLMRNVGMAAVRVSDYAEAVRALRPVVAADPRDQIARSLLGTSLYSTNNFPEAVQVFTPLGDSVLDQPELAYAWAASLVKITKFSQAAALLDKLEKRPLAAETLVLIAQTWSQMGNYPRAVESCHKALQLDPKLAQAHEIAGMALIRGEHPAEAASEFRAELELDPDNADAQYHLAFVLLQQSRNEEAVTLLRGVLARNPDHPQANYDLGRELLESGQKEEAIKYLEAAALLNPRLDAVHYQLQSAYRAVGRKEDADRELKIYRDMKAKNRNVNVPLQGERSGERPEDGNSKPN
jgi:tetratricopeptide (TPR) repeat protein